MIYSVKKGEHWFKPRQYRLFWKRKRLKVRFKFNKNCLYKSSYGQWNKLVGLSDFNTHHSKHSVRIGWRGSNFINIALALYTRINSEWSAKEMGFIEVEQWYEADIEIRRKEYVITFQGKEYSVGRKLRRKWGFNYFLQPDFRGKNTAYHDMDLELTWE
ncbi:MAG: hypothetical protein F6K19_01700 [Cyanothece sp. SIO1E1]|nr:hypothetical protein [Cyanothece sp. SIO1E1]